MHLELTKLRSDSVPRKRFSLVNWLPMTSCALFSVEKEIKSNQQIIKTKVCLPKILSYFFVKSFYLLDIKFWQEASTQISDPNIIFKQWLFICLKLKIHKFKCPRPVHHLQISCPWTYMIVQYNVWSLQGARGQQHMFLFPWGAGTQLWTPAQTVLDSFLYNVQFYVKLCYWC